MKRIKSIHFTKPEADSLRCSIEKIIEKGLRGIDSSDAETGAFRLPERAPLWRGEESSEDGSRRVRDDVHGDRSE